MFFIILLITFFNINAMNNCDTTIAPQKTITALELTEKKQAKLFFDTRAVADYSQKFIVELENARVYEDGHVITQDHLLLEDTVIKYPSKPLSEYHMLNRSQLPEARNLNGRVALLASPGSQCYYHWMFQILPRLKILKDLNIDYDTLYLEPINYPFQLETLSKIGLNNKKIVFAKPDSQISAAVLIVPSIAIKDPCFAFPAWVINFLRSEFLDESYVHKFSSFKKIYISRSKAASRRIVNEKEISELLATHGFKTVHLEDFSLLEQAALIHSADCIVSPHGSGLSNLVFAHTGARVIEIFNQSGFNKLFYHLAQAVDLQYESLIFSDQNLTKEELYHDDIFIDVTILERVKDFLNATNAPTNL